MSHDSWQKAFKWSSCYALSSILRSSIFYYSIWIHLLSIPKIFILFRIWYIHVLCIDVISIRYVINASRYESCDQISTRLSLFKKLFCSKIKHLEQNWLIKLTTCFNPAYFGPIITQCIHMHHKICWIVGYSFAPSNFVFSKNISRKI